MAQQRTAEDLARLHFITQQYRAGLASDKASGSEIVVGYTAAALARLG
jgi:fructosamine-3-kinase